MNNRERFSRILNFQQTDDRLPMVEWAAWWGKTVQRWKEEGLPADLDTEGIINYFGLDIIKHFFLTPLKDSYPYKGPEISGIKPIEDEEGYEKIRTHLFPDNLNKISAKLASIKAGHDNGDYSVRITLGGFFWLPRKLFGIEGVFYAYNDFPELIHRMNNELADYNCKVIEQMCTVLKPDFVDFREDVSYNKGSMISYKLFKEFMTPYYKRVIPLLKKHNITVFIDSDGNVEEMIPWFLEAGIDGVLPLERQAGVDVARIRENYPGLRMLGGYDKMVMSKGEKEMREEFTRLLPVMKSGGFIPSVDHQTPPEVSLENYRIYLKLFKEYCERAASARLQEVT